MARKSTHIELVVELTALNNNNQYAEIIAEAQAGEYHDYKNNKYVCGKVALVEKLEAFPELDHIRKAVINGEYDETPDEEDKAMLRKDIKANMPPEAAENMLKNMGLYE